MFLGEVAEFPTGQDEGITGPVVDDGLIADRRDRQGAGGLEVLDHAVAQVLGDRVFGCERNGGGFVRVTDPQEAGGRVEDRQNGTTLHLGGALGQGHSLAD